MTRGDEDEGPGGDGRGTISFWVIVAVAVVLFGVGLYLFVKGSPSGETSQLDVSMRRPQESTPSLPDGSDVPAGVIDVLEADGALTYALEPPPEWADYEGTPTATVAPVTVEPVDDGAALLVRVACASSAGEYLAQVGLTESASTITVMAVAVQPDDGAPCDPAATAREFRLPLQEPVGQRSVVVVPPGPVPG